MTIFYYGILSNTDDGLELRAMTTRLHYTIKPSWTWTQTQQLASASSTSFCRSKSLHPSLGGILIFHYVFHETYNKVYTMKGNAHCKIYIVGKVLIYVFVPRHRKNYTVFAESTISSRNLWQLIASLLQTLPWFLWHCSRCNGRKCWPNFQAPITGLWVLKLKLNLLILWPWSIRSWEWVVVSLLWYLTSISCKYWMNLFESKICHWAPNPNQGTWLYSYVLYIVLCSTAWWVFFCYRIYMTFWMLPSWCKPPQRYIYTDLFCWFQVWKKKEINSRSRGKYIFASVCVCVFVFCEHDT
jgi:hypothetical protein